MHPCIHAYMNLSAHSKSTQRKPSDTSQAGREYRGMAWMANVTWAKFLHRTWTRNVPCAVLWLEK